MSSEPWLDRWRLIKSLQAQRTMFDIALETLTPDEMLLPGVMPGWTVKDLLAHVARWDRRGTRWIVDAARGVNPDIPEPDATWADMDAINARELAAHRDQPLDDALRELAESWQWLLAAVGALRDDQLGWMITYPLGDGIIESTPLATLVRWRYRHYRTHRIQIESWIAERRGMEPPVDVMDE
ncbi:MAG: ClbS/DfsB family four-helix bundle protein [Anaerolineae bacterium]|nr:ClbS/DfsB family four-helix bundle protein [Anaerolineae bacterium]